MIFITASNSKCPGETSQDLYDIAQKYKTENIKIVVIGIGTGLNTHEFTILTTNGFEYIEISENGKTENEISEIFKILLKCTLKLFFIFLDKMEYLEKVKRMLTEITVTEKDTKTVTETIQKEVEVVSYVCNNLK